MDQETETSEFYDFFLVFAVLKLKSDDSRPLYNHTLTMTLVEYASAVS